MTTTRWRKVLPISLSFLAAASLSCAGQDNPNDDHSRLTIQPESVGPRSTYQTGEGIDAFIGRDARATDIEMAALVSEQRACELAEGVTPASDRPDGRADITTRRGREQVGFGIVELFLRPLHVEESPDDAGIRSRCAIQAQDAVLGAYSAILAPLRKALEEAEHEVDRSPKLAAAGSAYRKCMDEAGYPLEDASGGADLVNGRFHEFYKTVEFAQRPGKPAQYDREILNSIALYERRVAVADYDCLARTILPTRVRLLARAEQAIVEKSLETMDRARAEYLRVLRRSADQLTASAPQSP